MGFVMSIEELMARSSMQALFLDVEYVFAAWLTKPEIVQKMLPPPLEPGEKPIAWCMLVNYRETNFSPPYLESGISLPARYKGVEGLYSLSMPVTDGQSMCSGREFYGMPKKMADVGFESKGNRIEGWTERYGRRFFELKVDLDQPPQNPGIKDLSLWEATAGGTSEQQVRLFSFKAFRSPDWAGFDYPPRLIQYALLGELRDVRYCRAEIELHDSPYDPWAEIELGEIQGAIYARGRTYMGAGQVVAEVDPMQFAPYYMGRFDIYE